MPTRTRPGGLTVAAEEVSDIPHSSQISIPIARKNSITSGGVGAAPTAKVVTWSSPSSARTGAKTSSSARRHSASSSAGTSPSM